MTGTDDVHEVNCLILGWNNSLVGQRLYVVGAYVPPNDVPVVHWVDQSMMVKPKGVDTIFLGRLNMRLGGGGGATSARRSW